MVFNLDMIGDYISSGATGWVFEHNREPDKVIKVMKAFPRIGRTILDAFQYDEYLLSRFPDRYNAVHRDYDHEFSTSMLWRPMSAKMMMYMFEETMSYRKSRRVLPTGLPKIYDTAYLEIPLQDAKSMLENIESSANPDGADTFQENFLNMRGPGHRNSYICVLEKLRVPKPYARIHLLRPRVEVFKEVANFLWNELGMVTRDTANAGNYGFRSNGELVIFDPIVAPLPVSTDWMSNDVYERLRYNYFSYLFTEEPFPIDETTEAKPVNRKIKKIEKQLAAGTFDTVERSAEGVNYRPAHREWYSVVAYPTSINSATIVELTNNMDLMTALPIFKGAIDKNYYSVEMYRHRTAPIFGYNAADKEQKTLVLKCKYDYITGNDRQFLKFVESYFDKKWRFQAEDEEVITRLLGEIPDWELRMMYQQGKISKAQMQIGIGLKMEAEFEVEGFPGSVQDEIQIEDWSVQDLMYSNSITGNFLEDQAKFNYGLNAEFEAPAVGEKGEIAWRAINPHEYALGLELGYLPLDRTMREGHYAIMGNTPATFQIDWKGFPMFEIDMEGLSYIKSDNKQWDQPGFDNIAITQDIPIGQVLPYDSDLGMGAVVSSPMPDWKDRFGKMVKKPNDIDVTRDNLAWQNRFDEVTNRPRFWRSSEEEYNASAPKQTKVKFPRAKADKIVAQVEAHMKPMVDKMMACGSYRRGAQMIGDIDFVIIPKEGNTLPNMLPPNQGVNWVGENKAQVIIDGEKVDFKVTTPDAWGATILYFTGPADFNIKYRIMAKKQGKKLNEYGVWDRDTETYLAGKTEQDVYTELGRPYKEPKDRKGWNRKKAESETYPRCPICFEYIPNNQTPGKYPGALARYDNQTEICSECGTVEAMVGFMATPEMLATYQKSEKTFEDYRILILNVKHKMPEVMFGRGPEWETLQKLNKDKKNSEELNMEVFEKSTLENHQTPIAINLSWHNYSQKPIDFSGLGKLFGAESPSGEALWAINQNVTASGATLYQTIVPDIYHPAKMLKETDRQRVERVLDKLNMDEGDRKRILGAEGRPPKDPFKDCGYPQEFLDELAESNENADTYDEETIELAYQTWLYNKREESFEAPSADKVFGVQRHDAHRAGLHYDLRLERDGVLKSWSMPKGMPTDKRHLAIATSDHKMSWLEFEGDIPEGSYGAGKVSLDNTSTFQTVSHNPKKWVFYVNSGKYKGKYTLIHWKDDKWLISRNNDQSMSAETTAYDDYDTWHQNQQSLHEEKWKRYHEAGGKSPITENTSQKHRQLLKDIMEEVGLTRERYIINTPTMAYRAMPFEQYAQALKTGYLYPPEQGIYCSLNPTPTKAQGSWKDSPIFEIDVTGLQATFRNPQGSQQGRIITIDEPIPVDRILPYGETEPLYKDFNAWYDLATEKQRNYIKRLSGDPHPDINRRQASKLINQLAREKKALDQIDVVAEEE